MLFTRGTSEWVSRVNQKHKQLVEARLSAEQTEKLDRLIETEFVFATLKLEGLDVTRGQVEEAASHGSGEAIEGDNEQPVMRLLDSLRAVSSLARANGKTAELTRELLLNLHSVPGAAFRTSTPDISHLPKPVTPEHLPALLESACRWYTAESFAELNPIEQAAIVLLRLIDLQPFGQANERTALVAASLFTMRADLPPIIIKPEMVPGYRNALDEGIRMNTKPMVETIAEAVTQSLSEMIEVAGKDR